MTRLAVLALLLGVVAACGDGDDTPDVDAGAGGGGGATTSSPALPGDGGEDGEDSEDGEEGGTRPAGGEDAYAIADLTVEVTHPDRETITYRLSCLGDTVTVDERQAGVSAEAACSRLTDPQAVSLLVDGPDPRRVCPQVYGGPDEARVTGTLDGDAVDVVLDRSDGCAIDDWDRILAGVLPPAAAER